MPNVFEPEWEIELPEPWSLRGARLAHVAGVLEAYRRGDAVEQMADEPGG